MLVQEVDGGENLLDFVTDDVPPHFKRLPVDEFTMRLIGVRDMRAAREFVAPADECGNRHQAPRLRQTPGELDRFGHSPLSPQNASGVQSARAGPHAGPRARGPSAGLRRTPSNTGPGRLDGHPAAPRDDRLFAPGRHQLNPLAASSPAARAERSPRTTSEELAPPRMPSAASLIAENSCCQRAARWLPRSRHLAPQQCSSLDHHSSSGRSTTADRSPGAPRRHPR